MPRYIVKTKRNKLLVCLAVAAVATLLAVTVFTGPAIPRFEPVPNPNGYEDFVAAGQMLQGSAPSFKTGTVVQLRVYIDANRAALERACLGLSRECRVHTEYSGYYITRHVLDIGPTRKIADALAIEGKLADLENRPWDAAIRYLESMKLGADLARGGLGIDALLAAAAEAWGVMQIVTEIPKLNAEQSRALIHELAGLEATREPFEKILIREKMWSSRQGTLVERMKDSAEQLVTHSDTKMMEGVRSKYNQERRRVAQLEVDLARHAFELERGRKSTGWNDLVPSYLKTIPSFPGNTNDEKESPFVF